MTAPINLTQLRHDIENAYLPDGWTEPLLALIDTAEAAIADQAALDQHLAEDIAAKGLPAYIIPPETIRLRETLNRYTTTP